MPLKRQRHHACSPQTVKSQLPFSNGAQTLTPHAKHSRLFDSFVSFTTDDLELVISGERTASLVDR